MLSGTPWVDRTLRTVWDRMLAVVPDPSLLPRRELGVKKLSIIEFGCGHYGCVAPTDRPDIVFKLTSDVSEACFVAMAQQAFTETSWPDGLSKYHAIYHLTDAQFRNRPLFVLWRNEASEVGVLRRVIAGYGGQRAAVEPFDEYETRELRREGFPQLELFQEEASVVRAYVLPKLVELTERGNTKIDRQLVSSRQELLHAVWTMYGNTTASEFTRKSHVGRKNWDIRTYEKGLRRVGVALNNCRYAAQALAGTVKIHQVGQALDELLEQGLLLADVHIGNIGIDHDEELVITDPGHCIEVHPRWATLPTIPSI